MFQRPCCCAGHPLRGVPVRHARAVRGGGGVGHGAGALRDVALAHREDQPHVHARSGR